MNAPGAKFVKEQWPDNICSGFIDYSPSSVFKGGFVLRDASHGIPVLGGIHAEFMNYPRQVEDITRRLVACWNALAGKPIDEIEAMALKTAQDKS